MADKVERLAAQAKGAAGRPLTESDLAALLQHGHLGLSERETEVFVRGGYQAYVRVALSERAKSRVRAS